MILDYDRDREVMQLSCDSCSNEEEFEGEFARCIEQAKEAGWLVRPDEKEGGFTHTCPIHSGN